MQLLKQHIMEVLPPSLWKGITPELYIAFWTFNLRDVFLPKDEYGKQITRIKAEIASQEVNMRVVRSKSGAGGVLGRALCGGAGACGGVGVRAHPQPLARVSRVLTPPLFTCV